MTKSHVKDMKSVLWLRMNVEHEEVELTGDVGEHDQDEEGVVIKGEVVLVG